MMNDSGMEETARKERVRAKLAEGQRQDAVQAYEDMAAKERHKFINARAATRLLLGAYGIGDITQASYRSAVQHLDQAEPNRINVDEHIATVLKHPHVGSKPKPLADYIGDKAEVLIVDDEALTAGWKAFFDAIFPGKASYAVTSDEALNLVRKRGEHLAIVFLDLRLPNHPEEGLKLLGQIKKLHLDLPTLVFSAVEDIRYARRCMNAGAADYFVKALSDDQRDSIEYYRKFKDVVIASLGERVWRDIWAAIEELPHPELGAQGSALFKSVRDHFHRAYYFLTAPVNDPRIRLLFPNASGDARYAYSHSILECANAIEQMVNNQHDLRLRKKATGRHGAAAAALGAPLTASSFRKKLKGLSAEGVLDRDQAKLADEIWSSRAKAAHGKRASATQATNVFKGSLQFTHEFFDRLS
jgi:CheY-like chemotaxis protein